MKRRNILAGAVFATMMLTATSCSDYLNVDRYFRDTQSLEHIFSDRDYTQQWLATCYSRLQGNNIEIGTGQTYNIGVTNFSDDMIFNEGYNGEYYRKYKFGEYNYSWSGDSWKECYMGIRQASILIQHVDINKEMSREEITDMKGQARFLRAYFYWLLLRKYGPVPIMPDEGADYSKTYDELSLPRNTYDECAEYIASEMIKAAGELPEKRGNSDIARATKGAALAVRAKAYLYAASPLMNGNTEMADFTDRNGKNLISQTYDESKWAKAAAAAKDLIEYAEQTGTYRLYTIARRENGNDAYPTTIAPPEHPVYSHKNFPEGWADIDPFESYRSLFNGELYASENPELIFTRGTNTDKDDGTAGYGVAMLAKHQLPTTVGGYNCHGITLKQCDAYDMADGTPFNPATALKGYVTEDDVKAGRYAPLKKDVNLIYANREPRFYASVAYCGALWPCLTAKELSYQYQQVFYYRGETDGRSNANERWIPTGIGMMKYVNPNDCNYNSGQIIDKVDPTIRYADILLMYAEALNELTASYDIPSWDGSTTYTLSRDVQQMRHAVSQVRLRAGVPDYDDATYADAAAFRKKLKHERQIEFLGENQRYYDLRRWKDAPVEEAQQIYGCNTAIAKNNRDYFYERVRVPNLQTAFSRKMYFWPINYDELKRNKNMTQAPGWQDYD